MSEYFALSCIYIAETQPAICVDISDGQDTWIPKSLLSEWDDDERERGDVIEIEIEEWKAREMGLRV